MNRILEKSKVKLSWELAYVGLINNWLSADDVMIYVDPNELDKIDSITIAELYTAAEESKDEYLDVLKSIIENDENTLKKNIFKWQYIYLNDIAQSGKPIHESLRDIANIWAMVGYPPEWNSFIYYMPVSDNSESNESHLYQKFLNYLNKSKQKILDQN